MRRSAVILIVVAMVMAAFAPGAMGKEKTDDPGCSATGHWVAKYAQSGLGPFGEANMGQGWVKPLAHGEAEWLPEGTHVKDFIKFMQTEGFDPYTFFGPDFQWPGAWPSGLEDHGVAACAKHREDNGNTDA